jgi:hypothetical protein
MLMRRRQAKGLTRADVLVLLVLSVFLLAVGAPLASQPREQARRIVCKANLGKVGKAMLVYAGDYDGALPRAGGPDSEWGAYVIWNATDRYVAYGLASTGEGGKATISSCFYLLVKYLEMPPRLFVCPSDVGTSEFKLEGEILPKAFTLADAWDFGATPYDNCSYAYHLPFGSYPLTTARDPNLAVAADRNPWISSPAAEADMSGFSYFLPDVSPFNGTVEQAGRGNAISHERDGQNVLFLDGRVTFERRAQCGADNDNIYTRSAMFERGDAQGTLITPGGGASPSSARDSLLVHNPPGYHGPRSR